MKETGLILKAPMLRAILEGRKTQTRRVLRNQRAYDLDKAPLGQPGDRIYVRETFSQHPEWGQLAFRADGEEFEDADGWLWEPKWQPSSQMPKELARIWLEITGLRVERLQEISESDALAEGIIPCYSGDETFYMYGPGDTSGVFGRSGSWKPKRTPREAFRKIWESTGGDWDANPWVWVVDFKVLSTTGRPA